MTSATSYFLVGGAGFIGSHFVDALLQKDPENIVTIYDNFSSGRKWHYEQHLNNPQLAVVKGDVKERSKLTDAMHGHEVIFHFASNPDIARAAKEPSIDFSEGIELTDSVLESARMVGAKKVIYMSGSGVYGDTGQSICKETQGNLFPISTYGASKLAGEAFLSSYCHMFNMVGLVFRCGNIVGPRQTHGVILDFIKKLSQDRSQLTILGDGFQSKSYIHVSDVVSGIILASERCTSRFEVFNLATADAMTVREIAETVTEQIGLTSTEFVYTGGERGWKGDVPIVRLDIEKIKSLGWQSQLNSKEAVLSATDSIIQQVRAGLI